MEPLAWMAVILEGATYLFLALYQICWAEVSRFWGSYSPWLVGAIGRFELVGKGNLQGVGCLKTLIPFDFPNYEPAWCPHDLVLGPWGQICKDGPLLKDFLAVQWLRLCSSTAEGMGLIPGWGTKTLHATGYSSPLPPHPPQKGDKQQAIWSM